MTHPPIPPNDRFKTVNGIDLFAVYGYLRQIKRAVIWHEIDTLTGFNQRNCCNEARCVWLDEERSFLAIVQGDEAFDKHGSEKYKEFVRKCNEATENAEAWRIWAGKGNA